MKKTTKTKKKAPKMRKTGKFGTSKHPKKPSVGYEKTRKQVFGLK